LWKVDWERGVYGGELVNNAAGRVKVRGKLLDRKTKRDREKKRGGGKKYRYSSRRRVGPPLAQLAGVKGSIGHLCQTREKRRRSANLSCWERALS